MAIRTLFFLLSLHWNIVDAIPWSGPRPTDRAPLGAGWSPRPTGVVADPLNIFRRAGQYPLTVCGFIGGSLAIPATCSSGSTCVWFNDLTVIGCCTTSGNQCTFPTACLDGGSPTRTPDHNDPLTMTCPNSQGAQQCYTNSYPEGYTEVGCGYKSWATTVLTDGAKDVSVVVTHKPANFSPAKGVQSSSTAAATSSPSSSDTPSQSSSNLVVILSSNLMSTDSAARVTTVPTTIFITKTPSSGALTPTTAASSSQTTAVAADSRPSSNLGAIVGGTVGGVVVAGLAAGLLVWFVIRRNRRARDSSAAQAAWAQSPSLAKYEGKHASLEGRAELPVEDSPATTHVSEMDGNRLSELYGRPVYQPYRPPTLPDELEPDGFPGR